MRVELLEALESDCEPGGGGGLCKRGAELVDVVNGVMRGWKMGVGGFIGFLAFAHLES